MRSSNLSVSIVTPSFNHAAHIASTIQSVLSQDCPELDYIVVDGASNDKTVDILRQYDGRLRWISESDEGQSAAIKKGFAQARGDILGWLNSDDTYAPGAIAEVVRYFQEHPDVDVIYGNANFIDVHGDLVCPCAHIEPFSSHRLLHYTDFIVQPATFFRRSAYEAVGGLDGRLKWAMDYDLWLRLAERFRFAYLPTVLANFRWIGTNKTEIGGRSRIAEVEHIVRRRGARGLPAFFKLEMVRLSAREAVGAIREHNLQQLSSCVFAMLAAVSSWRACVSLLRPQTWRIIWTGQLLRYRTAALI